MNQGRRRPSPLGADAGDVDRLLAALDRLEVIAALVATAGKARAAEATNRSPSAVTRAVIDLERLLGHPVLHRRGGAWTATRYGAVLLARVERIATQTAALAADLARIPGVSVAAARHLLRSGPKLALLIHVADTGTLSGAAARLGISQPGVSVALRRIEEALGVSLFYRTPYGVSPTGIVARMVVHARRIRAELRHALTELAAFTGAQEGAVIVGALPMARVEVLPAAIDRCLAAAPAMRVRIVETDRDALLARLHTDEIDLVVAAATDRLDLTGIVTRPLLTDRAVVVAAPTHPLAGLGTVSLDRLRTARWIMPAEHAIGRILFEDHLRHRGVVLPRPAVETGDAEVIRSLLAVGDLVALASAALMHRDLADGRLVRVAVDLGTISRDIVLLRRDGVQLPASAALLAAELERAAAMVAAAA